MRENGIILEDVMNSAYVYVRDTHTENNELEDKRRREEKRKKKR